MEPAIQQLETIREMKWRRRVFYAVSTLARFPRRGRIPPEVARYPEVGLSAELREIVFPGLARVFYRYDERSETVRILAMTFRGQEVTLDGLNRLLED
jgi:plasmid stabilization system protein ParE